MPPKNQEKSEGFSHSHHDDFIGYSKGMDGMPDAIPIRQEPEREDPMKTLNTYLLTVAVVLFSSQAMAGGWTSDKFPVERIDSFLQGSYLRVLLVAAGTDESRQAADAMEQSLLSSKKVVSVQTMGPFSDLSDQDIISSLSTYLADVVIVLRVDQSRDQDNQAQINYYHQRLRNR
jgi:hypothetical protein